MTENYQDDTLRIFSLNANRPLAKFKLILKKVFVAIMSTSSKQRMLL